MKKSMIKKSILSLCVAFAATAAVGVSTVFTADASNTIDEKFESYTIAGSQVRYATTEDAREGFSFVVSMNAEDYAYVTNTENEYSNVKFGVLVGPEAYYLAHPFNDQAIINEYYSLNNKVDGKAMIYDCPAYELTAGADGNVSFRASVVDLEDENLIRDYRGVAYVEYTTTEGTEKYFITNDSARRCPVEIADLAIEKLEAQNETAEDDVVTANNEKIAALTTKYIDTVEWDAISLQNGGSGVWSQTWDSYVFGATGHSPAPNAVLKAEYRGNRYIESQYTTTYAYVQGEKSVPYSDEEGVIDNTKLEGIWTIEGTTVCEKLDAPVQTYTRQVTFTKLGGASSAFPKINGSQPATKSTNGATWDDTKKMYKFVDPASWLYVMPYSEKATGDFIVDFTLESQSRLDFRIYTSANNWFAIRTNITADGFFVRITEYNSESKLVAPANVFVPETNKLSLRVAMLNDVMYIYGKSYNDGSAIANRDNWFMLASVDAKSGLVGRNGVGVGSMGGGTGNTLANYPTWLNAATADEFGFGIVGIEYGYQAYAYISVEDDDAKVKTFVENSVGFNQGRTTVNGATLTSKREGAWAYDTTTGYYTNSYPEGADIKILDKATGDYMVTLKIKGAKEAEFRVYYGADNHFAILGLNEADKIFMDGRDAKYEWWTECRVGYDTSKFLSESASTATNSDGYTDLMLVRYQNAFYVYMCEYLDGEGASATYENWKLLIKVNADGTSVVDSGCTATRADGVSIGTKIHDYLSAVVKKAMTSNENAFAFDVRSGAHSGKFILNDNDADVATFMASEKTLAAYPKA